MNASTNLLLVYHMCDEILGGKIETNLCLIFHLTRELIFTTTSTVNYSSWYNHTLSLSVIIYISKSIYSKFAYRIKKRHDDDQNHMKNKNDKKNLEKII